MNHHTDGLIGTMPTHLSLRRLVPEGRVPATLHPMACPPLLALHCIRILLLVLHRSKRGYKHAHDSVVLSKGGVRYVDQSHQLQIWTPHVPATPQT